MVVLPLMSYTDPPIFENLIIDVFYNFYSFFACDMTYEEGIGRIQSISVTMISISSSVLENCFSKVSFI